MTYRLYSRHIHRVINLLIPSVDERFGDNLYQKALQWWEIVIYFQCKSVRQWQIIGLLFSLQCFSQQLFLGSILWILYWKLQNFQAVNPLRLGVVQGLPYFELFRLTPLAISSKTNMVFFNSLCFRLFQRSGFRPISPD